eukprot:851761-Heterocapsa_arctica.AAC.1
MKINEQNTHIDVQSAELMSARTESQELQVVLTRYSTESDQYAREIGRLNAELKQKAYLASQAELELQEKINVLRDDIRIEKLSAANMEKSLLADYQNTFATTGCP